jgi:glycolate oxidase FAD binding subunit
VGEERPSSAAEVAEALRSAARSGRSVRPRGGGTKLGWGRPTTEPDVELSLSAWDRIVEHNAADLTAVLQAGARLSDVQQILATAGQMLALDPPEGTSTIGGIVATGDSGPLRHRYRAVRDLLLGITVALADGSVATAGGKVIKNVAGYDLMKLFAGSFGTLGVILEVAVRLHPLPPERVTAAGTTGDPEAIQRAASAVTHAPLEAEAVDVDWADGSGSLLVRLAGAAPGPRARAAVDLIAAEGVPADLVEEDDALWDRQRARQRSAQATVVRVSGRQSALARMIDAAARSGGALVARAGSGLAWVELPPDDLAATAGRIEDVRRDLAPFPCVILDAPAEVRAKVDPWDIEDGPELRLMRRLKERFDPAHILNPGLFVGGI